jgi:hypothetical protein
MGMSREELVRWDEQRRIDEVSHIPVRKGRKRRGKLGSEPH